MQPAQMEPEAQVLLEEASPPPRAWANGKVLGVVGVVGLVCTVAVLPRIWSSKHAKLAPEAKNEFMQAQAAFIPFAQAQAMAGGAAPAAPAAAAPAAYPGYPGPYGAQQGYGAGVGHGPMGQPIAAHPEDFVAHADAPAQQQQPVPGGGGDKPVTLDVFYETKCPFSKQFINDEVRAALSDPTCVFQHVHINWEPYGNVQDTGGALVCQHGGDECFGNKLHLCAKKAFGGNDDGLNTWITCHIEFLSSNPSNTARDIAGYQNCPGADAAQLTTCANDPQIFEDFRKVGQETQAAQTGHMPWAITGIGAPNLQGNLLMGLCEMYGAPGALQGFPKPACCSV